ncbi:hypothetical protein GC102_31040 [Paenibacillus sp. LMG 31460]|uniref:Signal peptide containing protein n=1 Tax=Paenibacillus germinis TaxID=2654979 RepID=A0ABX1ZBC3_9BACL|nr:hypothetical protein [Paenibacillus germinis]NOU90149.1 hypothetical protein [Paenibacillus germinis]
MDKKRIAFVTAALSLSLVVGSVAGLNWDKKNNHSSLSVESSFNSLEEEFWNVDLIVRGTVLDEGQTYKQDSGVNTKGDNSIDITPSTIQISEVLYGTEANGTITYLQHGSSKDIEAKNKFLKKSEEVILILDKTEDGKYWSYNFDDGIWKVKNGKVESNTLSKLLNSQPGNSQDLDKFIEKIKKAAKNKKKEANE